MKVFAFTVNYVTADGPMTTIFLKAGEDLAELVDIAINEIKTTKKSYEFMSARVDLYTSTVIREPEEYDRMLAEGKKEEGPVGLAKDNLDGVIKKF